MERNPVLNSPEDITDELIEKILNNDLDSLTINYEFTRECNRDSETEEEWMECLDRINPFRRADSIRRLKRIEFEVRFSSNVRTLESAFKDFSELEFVNITDTSGIRSMKQMFAHAAAFNQPIGEWDTSNVTDMSGMFCGAESFNQPIGAWDTSMVEDMSFMFCHADSFNQQIGNWNTSDVRSMEAMFSDAKSFSRSAAGIHQV